MEFLAVLKLFNFQSISQDIYRLCRKQAQVVMQSENFQQLRFQNCSQPIVSCNTWFDTLISLAGEATEDCSSLKALFSLNLCPQW